MGHEERAGSRMKEEDGRFEYDSLGSGYMDEGNGGDAEMEDVGRDREKLRESGKHRGKERKKELKGERDHGSRDRDKSKEREGLDKERTVSRERRKEEERDEKDRDRDKERSRDKMREKGLERDKHREKEKDRGKQQDRDKEMDREREKSYDRVHERSKDRGRDREKDTEMQRERGIDREKLYDRNKDRERDRDRERGINRNKNRDRDHDKEVNKEVDRERGKEKDRERGKDRDREREKDRDRAKDREREEKLRDREMEKEKEKDKERHKGKEKSRDRVKEKSREKGEDTSVARDRLREADRSAEGEKHEWMKEDVVGSGDIAKEGEVQNDNDSNVNITSKDQYLKASDSHPSATELKERITKVKEERLKNKSDSSSEILSWVSKSRKLEEKFISEKEKASHRSKVLEEQDNIQGEIEDEEESEQARRDLAGVKILHGLDKVIEGGAVVLTLKDQNILADGDVNEDVDMLENVEIGEQKHRDEAYKAAKKKTGIYEDKFGDQAGSQKTILPQYDDPIVDEGVTLDTSGRFTGEAEKKLEELRRRLEGRSISKNFEDLSSSGRVSSDYFTPEEMLQFRKPKKKKALRKKDKLDLDALEAEAISAGLGASDLGSRKDGKRQSAKEEQERADAELRSNAYQMAYAKAEEASKALRLEQTLSVKAEDDENPVFGDDYEDLQKALEQTRKIALQKQEEAAVSGIQAVANQATAKNEQVDAQNLTAGESQENKVVMTEMEEFVLGLQFKEEAQKPESEDVFMDEEEVPKSVELETEVESGGWMEVKETDTDEEPASGEKEDIAPDKNIHEISVGKGLSGALQLLKERGTLKETVEWGGRNMDKKKSKLVGINDNEGPKEIRIERTDEFGRILTPKEAFRQISHKFHGKGPGKMKQEKRMKQYQEELKLKQMEASDTPSHSVGRMREAQAQLKTPYLVLSGHVKPGQTSDPMSGFATVEKDHPGSLTPMLGYRKVEHFLGIKRKADSGSMGPPAPRKPKG